MSLAALLASALSLTAQEATVMTAQGQSVGARDVSLSTEGGALTLRFRDASGAERSLPAGDVVELVFGSGRSPAPARPGPADVEVRLSTGDVVRGTLGARSDEGVQLSSESFGNLLVKFGQIRSLVFLANEAFAPKRPPEKVKKDLVFTKAGDRGEGTVLSASAAGVEYNSESFGRDVTVACANMAGFWLTVTEKAPKEPAELFMTLLTTDGASVRGRVASLREGVLAFKDLYGGEHKVPANRIAGLYVKNGRVVYLSDLEPAAVEEDANFIRGPKKLPSDLEYPFQRDRSARGGKIVLGGVEHRKGLGVRAHSSLSFALAGGFKRFQSTFGLDAAARDLGSVLAEVWVDGRKAKDLALKAGDAPLPVDLDVSGARELRLVVTWGGTGQSDFAGWGSARLIR
jgi:hypothetical protein